jgi:hypothetical protein
MKKVGIVLLLGCFFLATGLFCLFWPEKIRLCAIRYSEMKILGVVNPYLDWIKSSNFLFSLRVIGILSIIAFLIACYVVIQTIK